MNRSIIAALTVALIARQIWAQPADGVTRHIEFDRPEAWAMKRTASLTLFTVLGPPRERTAGDVELGLELGWNPSLSQDEMRVGFNGTKVEDMGRLAVIPRVRVSVGMGRKTSLDLTYTPPISIEGLEPNLFAAAVSRPVWRSGPWILGVRAMGQIGDVTGDITCPAHEAATPPGDPGNEFGCEERSHDVVTLDWVGVGLAGGYELPGSGDTAVYVGLYADYMDLAFQVDALTYGFRDRTRLVTAGWTWAATGGVSFRVGRPTRLAVEIFYSPLDVDRPIFDEGGSQVGVESRNDALLNVRAAFTYTF